MKFGGAMFFTDYSMTVAELAAELEERGFEFSLGSRALSHPSVAQDALSWRWRPAQGILRCDGPICSPRSSQSGDQNY